MWRSRSMSRWRVAAVAAAGARRVDEALALVDAQRLGVHAGQLGRHRDHVHGAARALTAEQRGAAPPALRSAPVVPRPLVRSSSGRRGVIGVHLQMGTRLVVRDAGELLDRGALLVGQLLGHGHLDGDEEVTGRASGRGRARPGP